LAKTTPELSTKKNQNFFCFSLGRKKRGKYGTRKSSKVTLRQKFFYFSFSPSPFINFVLATAECIDFCSAENSIKVEFFKKLFL
jgi:hypothetical protein